MDMYLIIKKRNKFETKSYFVVFWEKDSNAEIRRKFESKNIEKRCHIELIIYSYTI